MEKQEAYTFTEDEIHVLKEALAMYASYKQVVVMPALVGDESDLDNISKEASISQRMAYHFIEEDEGETFESLSRAFQEYKDRPMDLADVSEFDWYEFREGNLNR